jgi:DNA invertase Pin-like site-specific DNA recombinase
MIVNDNHTSSELKEFVYEYKVAVYLRLSKEDETIGQSTSIENQRNILMEYVRLQGWVCHKVYIDDGYSGLRFDRPGFRQLLSDIEKKKINLVITKDLSRLGRDYIATGYYLERYFPEKNIRYIALSDGIDTSTTDSFNDMGPFKSLLNDMYAKDISKKIRFVFDQKRKRGQFIGAFAPYGYLKDPNNKNKLIIDPYASSIVVRMYNLILNDNSMGAIAKILNEEKVPSPIAYKETFCNYKNRRTDRRLWNQGMIKNVCTNPTYLGHMAQKRSERVNYKSKKMKNYKQSEWIIVENTHEPIIEQDQYNLVQEMIVKKAVLYSRKDGAKHLLNGLVYCKECGAKLTYKKVNGQHKMNCIMYLKHGKDYCCSHYIDEETLNDFVVKELINIADKVLPLDYETQFGSLVKKEKLDMYGGEILQLEKRCGEIQTYIKRLYEDRVKNIIANDTFISLLNDYSKEKETINTQYQHIKKLQQELKASQIGSEDYKKCLIDIIQFKTTDKAILTQLIEKIDIDKDRNVFISYNFKNPFPNE